MKILILANFDVGLYQFRRELIAKLLERHQVMIGLPDGALVRPLEEMGCQFYDTPLDRRGVNPAKDLKLLLDYIRLMRKLKPDLVITYTIKPNVYGGMACRLLGIPYAANITGLGTTFQKPGLLRSLVIRLYQTALKKARVVFFENQDNLNVLRDMGIVREGQCRLLNGAGVNLERFRPAPYPEKASPVRFLFIGRIMAEKGVNELLAATRRLINEGYACTLDVLGYAEEDYTRPIQECADAGWLRFHGYQTDVRPFIENSHCFVLPSWHEGMANTNLECAAMGRPVITSDIHGCKEAVEDGISGLLCGPKDADSLYNAMKAFCQMPNEARRAMGLAGRAHMEQIFDKKKVVEETMKGLGL